MRSPREDRVCESRIRSLDPGKLKTGILRRTHVCIPHAQTCQHTQATLQAIKGGL